MRCVIGQTSECPVHDAYSRDGPSAELFAHLAADLRRTRAVRLIYASWLSDDDFKRRLDEVFASFRKNGGRIEH